MTSKSRGKNRRFFVVVAKAQRLLWKCERERAQLRRDLAEAKKELEREKAFSCYLWDCREFLIISLYDAGNKCPQVDNIKEKYGKFALSAGKRLEEKLKMIF